MRTFRKTSPTLELNLSCFGTHPRFNWLYGGHSKLKLSAKGQSKLKLSGNGI